MAARAAVLPLVKRRREVMSVTTSELRLNVRCSTIYRRAKIPERLLGRRDLPTLLRRSASAIRRRERRRTAELFAGLAQGFEVLLISLILFIDYTVQVSHRLKLFVIDDETQFFYPPRDLNLVIFQ